MAPVIKSPYLAKFQDGISIYSSVSIYSPAFITYCEFAFYPQNLFKDCGNSRTEKPEGVNFSWNYYFYSLTIIFATVYSITLTQWIKLPSYWFPIYPYIHTYPLSDYYLYIQPTGFLCTKCRTHLELELTPSVGSPFPAQVTRWTKFDICLWLIHYSTFTFTLFYFHFNII